MLWTGDTPRTKSHTVLELSKHLPVMTWIEWMAKADLCRCPCLHWVPGTQTTRWKCVWGKFDEEWSQEEMRKAGLGRVRSWFGNSAAGRSFTGVLNWGKGLGLYVLASTSHWLQASPGRGSNLWWGRSLWQRDCPRRLWPREKLSCEPSVA